VGFLTRSGLLGGDLLRLGCVLRYLIVTFVVADPPLLLRSVIRSGSILVVVHQPGRISPRRAATLARCVAEAELRFGRALKRGVLATARTRERHSARLSPRGPTVLRSTTRAGTVSGCYRGADTSATDEQQQQPRPSWRVLLSPGRGRLPRHP
jgi:hypothetical protein